jgi:hypothetical protein
VLERKEIENYFLEENSLIRTIIKRILEKGSHVNESEALQIINECLESLRADTSSKLIGSRIEHSRKTQKAIAPATVIKAATQEFDQGWSTLKGRLSLVSGKEFISMLSGKLQAQFGCGLTHSQIAGDLGRTDISRELEEILRDFDRHLAS